MKNWFAIFSILFVGCVTEEEERQERQERLQSIGAANAWLKQHNIEGVASCNYPNPNFCDVIPRDPRPPILLFCNVTCRVSKQ